MSSSFDDFVSILSKQSVKRATDIQLRSHIPYGIPTRIPQLDLLLRRPGFPAGRVIETYGFEGSGKTSLSLAAVAAIQRMGGRALWIDAEHAFDPLWAAKNGVDVNRLLLAEADSIEGILKLQQEAIQAHVKTNDENAPFLMVTDSITAVPSQESVEKEIGDTERLGVDARAIRTAMRKLNPMIAEAKVVAIYINHSTAKPGAMAFAKQSQSAGGHALKFYASLRLELARTGTLWEEVDGQKVKRGMKVNINIEKNKITGSEGKIECMLIENGFDLVNELFTGFEALGDIKQQNVRTYLHVPSGEQITKKEWRTLIDDKLGGVDKAYETFLERAVELGRIQLYLNA